MDNQKLHKQLQDALIGKRDTMFTDVVDKIHCMSRPRVYAVINAIVSAMDVGELYLEVGTYQGGSLISALLGNSARAIGVDSFGEFTQTNNYEQTQGNLERFGVADRVELKNMRYQDFFASLPRDFRAQVYYYDGAHDYETQLSGMEAAWPYLQKGSIILVDDYSYPEVNHAVNQFVANHIHEIKFQFVMSAESLDVHYWNGIVAMRVV